MNYIFYQHKVLFCLCQWPFPDSCLKWLAAHCLSFAFYLIPSYFRCFYWEIHSSCLAYKVSSWNVVNFLSQFFLQCGFLDYRLWLSELLAPAPSPLALVTHLSSKDTISSPCLEAVAWNLHLGGWWSRNGAQSQSKCSQERAWCPFQGPTRTLHPWFI